MTELISGEDIFLIRKASIENVGNGLFASRPYLKGEKIMTCMQRSCFQPIYLVNHSCEPSCELDGKIVLSGGRGLTTDQEITIDYREITFFVERLDFKCLCGSPRCGGHITVGI